MHILYYKMRRQRMTRQICLYSRSLAVALPLFSECRLIRWVKSFEFKCLIFIILFDRKRLTFENVSATFKTKHAKRTEKKWPQFDQKMKIKLQEEKS